MSPLPRNAPDQSVKEGAGAATGAGTCAGSKLPARAPLAPTHAKVLVMAVKVLMVIAAFSVNLA